MKYVLLLLILLGCKYYFIKYNRDVYNWHNTNIYQFEEMLTILEKEYIQKCIDLSWYELFRPFYIFADPLLQRLSYYTFGHKSVNGIINSSRIAYGSTMRCNKAYMHAKKVLQERKIVCEIQPGKNYDFYGIGWDFKQNHFKIYFRFHDYRTLPTKYKSFLPPIMINNFKNGLVSITYVNGLVVERKVYWYPKKEKVAKLCSNQRIDVQIDCNEKHDWEINKIGKELIHKYETYGYELDTITIKDINTYSLYFPK